MCSADKRAQDKTGDRSKWVSTPPCLNPTKLQSRPYLGLIQIDPPSSHVFLKHAQRQTDLVPPATKTLDSTKKHEPNDKQKENSGQAAMLCERRCCVKEDAEYSPAAHVVSERSTLQVREGRNLGRRVTTISSVAAFWQKPIPCLRIPGMCTLNSEALSPLPIPTEGFHNIKWRNKQIATWPTTVVQWRYWRSQKTGIERHLWGSAKTCRICIGNLHYIR